MAFIDKKDPVVLNIKLTSKGRELLASGNLKFKYFAIGDSEVDYNFNAETGNPEEQSSILRPLDNNPNILSFITKEESGDTYNELPSSINSQYLVTNTPESIGFFTNISGNSFTFNTDPDHVKQPNAMIEMTGVLGGNQIALKKIPSLGWNGNEPKKNDILLVKWTLNDHTTGNTLNINKPIPILIYQITGTTGTLAADNLIVTVDREIPDFSSFSPTGIAGALIYYSGDTAFSGNSFSINATDYLNESVLALLENSKCPTVIYPFWNMSIVFTEQIAGVQMGKKPYGEYNTKKYAGFISYIQNQAPFYKKLGIIHYTNSSPSNVYAEGFYLNTAKLIVPTIMWHKSSGSTLGATFIAGNGYTLDGLDVHYYDLVDASNPTVIVGKIFDELKLFVIEDPELLFAMSYKSNRSWTLPMPVVAVGGGCAEPVVEYGLTTKKHTNVGAGSIIGTGGINIKEYGSVTEYGMQFKLTSSGTWSSTIRGNSLTNNYFTGVTIGNLNGNAVYQYRAYVVYDGVNLYTGDVYEATTQAYPVVPTVPAVQNLTIGSVTQTSAVGTGQVLADGNATVTERGFVWNTSPNPTIANNKTSNGTGVGAFSSNLTSLAPNTTYYARAYATNSVGTAYDNDLTFTTLAPVAVAPTVSTSPVIDIVTTGAKSGGNVSSDGGAAVTARGVVISTSSNPTISSYTVKVDNGSGTGAFLSLISGLVGSTTYHIRAFATNSVGTSYGDDLTFITAAAATLPTVTGFIDIIGTTDAYVDGNVTSDGGATVTTRGTVWSTITGPTITVNQGIIPDIEGGTGAFSSHLTGLVNGTTYYFRSFATNSVGTAYGAQGSFTTASPAIPVYMNSTLSNPPTQCQAVLETTPPIMPAGSCFSLTLNYDVYKGPMKSSAFACVKCNGVVKYSNTSAGTNEFVTYHESGSWGPFTVKDTDTVCFCATAIDVLGGDPYASIAISSVSNIVGNYTEGSPSMVWAGVALP